MTIGNTKQRQSRLGRAVASLLAAGLALPLGLRAADPPPAAVPVKPAVPVEAAAKSPALPAPAPALPADAVPLAPKDKTNPDLHPGDFPFFNRGTEDFRSSQPPFIAAPPAAERSPVILSREEQDMMRKDRNWIVQRPENQTSPDAIKKLFKYGDYQLAGSDKKTKETGSWMEEYMEAMKPAKPASKGTDREHDKSQNLTDDPKSGKASGKEEAGRSKTDKQAFQDAEDKWSMVLEKASASAFPDLDTDAVRAARSESKTAADFQKQEDFQRKEISQLLNFSDEQTSNPRQSIGNASLGLGGLQPQQDQFNLVTDRGLLKAAPSSSVLPAISGGSLDGFKAQQLPSINFQPGSSTPLGGPSLTPFTTPGRPAFEQPATLSLPTRPGMITPAHF